MLESKDNKDFKIIKQIPDEEINKNCKQYTRVYEYKNKNKETVCGVDFFYKCGYLNDQPIFNKISVFFLKKNLDLSQCENTEDIIKQITLHLKSIICRLNICTLEQLQKLEQHTGDYITLFSATEEVFKHIDKHFSKAATENNKHFLYPLIKFMLEKKSFTVDNIEDIKNRAGVFLCFFQKIIDINKNARDALTIGIKNKIETITALLELASTNTIQDNQKNETTFFQNLNSQIKNELEGILSLIDESTSKTTNNDSIERGCNLRSCLSCCKLFRDS